jgi:hypothetical protein
VVHKRPVALAKFDMLILEVWIGKQACKLDMLILEVWIGKQACELDMLILEVWIGKQACELDMLILEVCILTTVAEPCCIASLSNPPPLERPH